MEDYTALSYEFAERLTRRYSTSFGLSTRLLSPAIRPHIYAIYGMVRLADEIVDTHANLDHAQQELHALELQTLKALGTGYSTNPLLHAFALSARHYGIEQELIKPFFASMRMDLHTTTHTAASYKTYIYGSAEVVGLMCLKVFTGGDTQTYNRQRAGAQALGRAYQKVNFLRDYAADTKQLGRHYFPGDTGELSESLQQAVVNDISKDFITARPAIDTLPASCRRAVALSYSYYTQLLTLLAETDVATLATTRIRVNNGKKAWLYLRARLGLL